MGGQRRTRGSLPTINNFPEYSAELWAVGFSQIETTLCHVYKVDDDTHFISNILKHWINVKKNQELCEMANDYN